MENEQLLNPQKMSDETSKAVPLPPVKYAGFWIRAAALIIDGLIVLIPILVIQYVFNFIATKEGVSLSSTKILILVINFIIVYGYSSLMIYYKEATLGKMLMHIQVKSVNLQKLLLGRILLREIVGKIISSILFSLGYLLAAFTENKQALHDKIAGSVVVYKNPSKPTSGTIIAIIIVVIFFFFIVSGTLFSTILTSLSTARSKGVDAEIKASLNNARPIAEVYYAEHGNSYSKSQSCSTGMFADGSVSAPGSMRGILANLQDKNVMCYAEDTSYAISANLEDSSSFCVDNTGYLGKGTARDYGSVVSCGENTTH